VRKQRTLKVQTYRFLMKKNTPWTDPLPSDVPPIFPESHVLSQVHFSFWARISCLPQELPIENLIPT
jgi:hypothetical protein